MLPYWRLSAYYFCYFAFLGAFSPYFTLYLRSLSFSAWDIGVLMSLMQVMRMVAPNIWGWLAGRMGAVTPIVRLAGAMSTVGFALFFFTQSFAGVFVGMALMSFFWSAALPLVETLTLAHLDKAPQRYGSIRLWGSVGFIVAVLAAGRILNVLPIFAIVPIACATLFGTFLCALLIPEAARPALHVSASALRDILRRPEVRGLLLACFFMSAAHAALYVFYSIYLVTSGYDTATVGGLWTLGVLSEIVMFLNMARLQRRFALRSIMVFALLSAVVRFATIGWGVQSLLLLIGAQILHGVTFGAYHAAAVAVIGRWFSGPHQARGQALYGSISFGAGGLLGALVSGYVWDIAGPPVVYTISAGFAAAGCVALCAGWRVSPVRPALD